MDIQFLNPPQGFTYPDVLTIPALSQNSTSLSYVPDSNLGVFDRAVTMRILDFGNTTEIPLTFHINQVLPPAGVILNVLTPSFTLPVGHREEGALKLTNNGTIRAYNITLTDSLNWINFTQNDFELDYEPGNNSEIIEFFISARTINLTTETNRTYRINITAAGLNFGPVNQEISVFVPFVDVSNLTCDFYRQREVAETVFLERCREFPFSAGCHEVPFVKVEERIEYVPAQCQLKNLSQEDLDAYAVCQRDKRNLESLFYRVSNTCQEDVENLTQEYAQFRVDSSRDRGIINLMFITENLLLAVVLGARYVPGIVRRVRRMSVEGYQ